MRLFSLEAVLNFDMSEFEKGLDSASKQMNGFAAGLQNKLTDAAKVAGNAIKTIGTVTLAAGGIMIAAAGKTSEYGDEIDKASQKLGISAQAYQEWAYILEHSGSSIDVLGTAMRNLVTLANSNDSKETKDLLKEIGLNLADIENMSQEELFDAVIKGLQGMNDDTRRAYIANKLLGRSASDLAPLLNTSAEETENMRQKVHDLGGVMSDDAVKASAAFQDSLTDLRTRLGGIRNSLTVSFLPAMTKIADGLTKVLGKDSTGWQDIEAGIEEFKEIGSGILNNIVEGIKLYAPEILEGGINAIINTINDLFGTSLPNVTGFNETISSALTNVTNFIHDVLEWIDFNGESVSVQAGLLAAGLAMLYGAINPAGAVKTGLALGITWLATHWSEVTDAVQGIIDKIKEFFDTVIPQSFKNLIGDIIGLWTSITEAIGGAIAATMQFLGLQSSGTTAGEKYNYPSVDDQFYKLKGWNDTHRAEYEEATESYYGGRAVGMDYVPYDGFKASLHEGEAVLTKLEAGNWRNGAQNTSGGMSAAELKATIREAVSTIALTMDKTIVGQMVADEVSRTIAMNARLGLG